MSRTVQLEIVPLSDTIGFDAQHGEMHQAGQPIYVLASFVDESCDGPIETMAITAPTEPGYYLLIAQVFDAETHEYLPDLRKVLPICVVDMGDSPYLLPPTPRVVRQETAIACYVPVPAVVQVRVRDSRGMVVDVIVDQEVSVLLAAFQWVPDSTLSGQYTLEMTVGKEIVDHKKITVIR